MRLYIIATTSLPIPRPILLDYVKEIVKQLVNTHQYEIVIVGDHLPDTLTHFCEALGAVNIYSTPTANIHLKQEQDAVLLHFGTTLKAGKIFPTYFIPLTLPIYHQLSLIQQFLQRKQFNHWMQKANKVICLNNWMHHCVTEQYPTSSSKCSTVHLPTLTVPSFEWQNLSMAQEQLTKGSNYFLCFAPPSRFVAILKEFSIFKKWQLTTMHLVFVHDTKQQVAASLKQLEGYKFREDIAVICIEDFQLEWIAASYAILWEDIHYASSLWMDYAIQYEIPLLFDKAADLPQAWAKLGEVFSFSEPNALSNHFKLYYKDEVYRLASARLGKDWLLKQQQTSAEEGHPSIGNILALRVQQ